uniref:nuclear GTPase SLIP-GC-like n=1 Tax=Monopterus albus TaxID=43700 RepID=UPI0009B2EA91|nr:nuclear GTPase SLIP-GC-like [Monopterus albus]
MIKVETNMHSLKYEAEIEFITKEEWKDELWSLYHILGDDTDQGKDNDEYCNTVEKLSALYGEDTGRNWKNTSLENLMDDNYFREIPEFLKSKPKILECKSAEELSAEFVKFTRSDRKQGEGKEVKRWYWPLVKCVIMRVPSNDLLQHVTLVDLLGTGDCNRSRDRMWKELVGNCSTMWIVTDISRAESENDPWEILKSACSLMGNGGECQRIHFICTKSDDVGVHSAANVRDFILETNKRAKEEVKRKFSRQDSIKKHFSDECFKVFTVSSKEFLKGTVLDRDETEIPKLQEVLKNLNDCHSETLNYVSGAHGILSLIQGARCRDVTGKKMDVYKNLEAKLKQELDEVRKSVKKSNEAFDRCLTEGVEKSKSFCEEKLKSILYPKQARSDFHETLRCVVENSGTYKPKKRKQIYLNVMLSSSLTDSIDEEFRKTFPNEAEHGPFNGVINKFSLNTQRLIEMNKDVELQLIFLKTEVKALIY